MGPAKTGGVFHSCLLLPTTQSDILTFGATRTVVPASSLSRADYWSKKALQLESIFASTNEQKTSLILSFLMAALFFYIVVIHVYFKKAARTDKLKDVGWISPATSEISFST